MKRFKTFQFPGRKSVITGKNVKLPKNITVTDHFTDLIQHGDVDGDNPALIGDNGETLWTYMQLDLTANKVAKAMRWYCRFGRR